MNYISTVLPSEIKSAQEEEFFQFVKALLEMMELDILPPETTSKTFDIVKKREFNQILANNQIEIVDNCDGSFEILLQGNTVAVWNKPWVTLRKNESERDPKKKIMAEIKFEFSSIYEEVEQDG